VGAADYRCLYAVGWILIDRDGRFCRLPPIDRLCDEDLSPWPVGTHAGARWMPTRLSQFAEAVQAGFYESSLRTWNYSGAGHS